MTNILPASGGRLECYLINLDRAAGRLADMDARLRAAGIGYRRVSAVDGATLPDALPEFSARGYALLHGRRRTPPEIGCYLSHVACARAFLETDADYALILEDDVVPEADLLATIDKACLSAGTWDILRLSSVNSGRKYPYKRLDATRSLAIALTREKGAGAYVVNRRAAQWIVTRLLPMRLAYDIAFDLEFLSGLKAAFVWPLPADQNTGYETQIQKRIQAFKLPFYRYLTVFPYRLYLETTRLILRSARLLLNRAKA